MKPRKSTYLLHRWFGLVVCLQLLAWSAGGFIFSVLPLDVVRGEHQAFAQPFDPITSDSIDALPLPLRDAIRSMINDDQDIGSVTLCDRGIGPFWEIARTDGSLIARLYPADATPAPPISSNDAQHIAARDFLPSNTVVDVTLIEADPPIEYRKGPLPAYAVEFDHPNNPHIYVHAPTGEITARRNRPWRIFDFFWMLHTMDYTGRDNFNHPLLTSFSVLALTTAASGLLLWGWRIKPRRATAGI